MIRTTVLLFALMVSALAVENQPANCHPIFALAFHSNEITEGRVEALNRQSVSGASPFSEKLTGIIESNGVRIGGEYLGLKGTYYDQESQSILHVGGGVTLSGPRFSFDGFPAGDYFLVLEVQGTTEFLRRVHLPLSEEDAKDFKVIISKPVEITGTVENLPVWALESPLVGIGPSLTTLDKSGHFKFSAPAKSSDLLVVKVRFSNPLPKEWEQPLIRYEFYHDLGKSPQTLSLPEVGNWKVSLGQVKFGNGLPDSLKPVLQNISIVTAASDGKLAYRCNPDTNGKFLIIGLPDGKYSVSVDDFGNPPFVADPIPLSVVDHRADQIELILHTHNSIK